MAVNNLSVSGLSPSDGYLNASDIAGGIELTYKLTKTGSLGDDVLIAIKDTQGHLLYWYAETNETTATIPAGALGSYQGQIRIEVFQGTAEVDGANSGAYAGVYKSYPTSIKSFGDAFAYHSKKVDIINIGVTSSTTADTSISATVDTTAPTISNIVVAGDDNLTQGEAISGFSVAGKATGADGQTITVQILGASNAVVATQTATVTGGNWTVNFPANVAIDSGTYHVKATVTDGAGNTGSTTEDFSSTACFYPGTMIRTPDGEVAVETLTRGDRVLTSDGRAMPVTWIGLQTISTRFADPLRVLPIRVKAGALGDNLPARDLLLSPDHALLVGGSLIQAGALVNGTSIVRETGVPQVFTYYHVELDDHSLILAEGVPAETFVDNVDRLAFDNWSEHQALYPNGKAISELPYPRAKAHRQVPVGVRVMLAERARAIGAAMDAVA